MTARTATPTTTEAAILSRLLAGGGKMSPALARHLLTLGLAEADQARMADLAARNQEGGLSPAEREELTGYVRAGHVLALLHSQARRVTKAKARS